MPFSKAAGVPSGVLVDFDEPRTIYGRRRLSARLGWVGETGDLFSILPG